MQELLNLTDEQMVTYAPFLYLGVIVILLLVISIIMKINNSIKKKYGENANVSEIINKTIAKWLAKNKTIKKIINSCFQDALKNSEADINNDGIVDIDEFKIYLIKIITAKAHLILKLTKFNLILNESRTKIIVDILMESLFKEYEQTIQELFGNNEESSEDEFIEEDVPIIEDETVIDSQYLNDKISVLKCEEENINQDVSYAPGVNLSNIHIEYDSNIKIKTREAK